MLDLLLFLSAVFSQQQNLDPRVLLKHFDVQVSPSHQMKEVTSVWGFFNEPFPICVVPAVILLAPVASGVSTCVSYIIYTEMQNQMDMAMPGSDEIGPLFAAPERSADDAAADARGIPEYERRA